MIERRQIPPVAPPRDSRTGFRALGRLVTAAMVVAAGGRSLAVAGAPGAPYPEGRIARLVEATIQMRLVDVSAQGPPALDPRGALLAYVVQASAPDAEALRAIPPRASEREAFLIRRPKTLFLLEVATGEARPISPQGASGWQPAWSPDGRSLAFYSDAGGGIGLWIHDLHSGRTRRVGDRRVAEGFEVTAPPRWSPDGRSLHVALAPLVPPEPSPDVPTVDVRRSGRERAGEPAAAGRIDPGFNRSFPADLAEIDAASGAARLILRSDADPRPQRPYPSASGRWLAYTSPPRNNVWLSGGRTPPGGLPRLSADLAVVSSRGGRPAPLAGDIDVDGVRWHPSRDALVYLAAGAAWAVELDEGAEPEPRRLAPELGALTGPLAFTRDGRVLVASRAGDRGARDLAWIPVDGSAGRVIAARPGLSPQQLVVDRDGTLWQPDGGSFTAVLLDDGTDESVVWRADLADGAGAELWRAPGRLWLLEPSHPRRGIVGGYESPREPRELYWFSHDFTEQRRLTRTNPGLGDLAEDAIGSIEFFDTRVPSFDGSLASVRTAVLLPPGAARDGSARGIVCVYPGNDLSLTARSFGGGERCGVPSHVLTARGFAVLLPHLLKRPRDTAGDVSREYADALLPIAYRAGALGYVDAGRLALFGHSQGAYAASAVISETNLFRAAVAASSVAYDLIATWGYMRPGFIVPNIWPITGYLMSGPPWEDLKRYLGNSPYVQADRIDTPLLIVVGTEDRFPHTVEAGKFFNALRTYDKTAQLAIYEGEDHYLFRGTRANALDLWNRMLGFLDRYVPADPEPPRPAR